MNGWDQRQDLTRSDAPDMSSKKEAESDFAKDLSSLLNRFCKENDSNTPDFILAEYLIACLNNFNVASMNREKWYGRELKIEIGEIK